VHDVVHIPQNRANFKVEAVCPKSGEQHIRSRGHQHHRVGFCDFFQDAGDHLSVRAIGHTHRNNRAAHTIATRIIGHGARNQIGVGHDDVGAIKGLDPGRAHRDIAHIAHLPADLDPVALADRAFNQQDDAADKVGHDVLQAETNADRQRTRDDGQPAQVDARRGNRDHGSKENSDVSRTGHNSRLPTGIHFRARQNRGPQGTLGQARDCITDCKHHREQQEVRR